jgi:hypothetical protein
MRRHISLDMCARAFGKSAARWKPVLPRLYQAEFYWSRSCYPAQETISSNVGSVKATVLGEYPRAAAGDVVVLSAGKQWFYRTAG